jgi:hypothetical protein
MVSRFEAFAFLALQISKLRKASRLTRLPPSFLFSDTDTGTDTSTAHYSATDRSSGVFQFLS